MLEVALAEGVDPDGRPSWNVPPTRGVPAITERHALTDSGELSDAHERVLDVLRWGLVPAWAKNPNTGYKMINAKAETVATKPAYRSAFAKHRCLIVVDGFFEWQVPDADAPKRKVPFYFRRTDGQPITFAGLYETWWDKSRSKEPDPETMLRTCTIITTNAAGSCNTATFTFSTVAWGAPAANACAGTTGGSALVTSGSQIQMTSTVNLNSAGDSLVVVGQGSFAGTEPIAIP